MHFFGEINNFIFWRRIIGQGLALSDAVDYDGRTALHVAAAEGQLEVCEFLLEKCEIDPSSVRARDRFGFTPLDEAIRFKYTKVIEYLEKAVQPLKEQPNEQEQNWIIFN